MYTIICSFVTLALTPSQVLVEEMKSSMNATNAKVSAMERKGRNDVQKVREETSHVLQERQQVWERAQEEMERQLKEERALQESMTIEKQMWGRRCEEMEKNFKKTKGDEKSVSTSLWEQLRSEKKGRRAAETEATTAMDEKNSILELMAKSETRM